MQAYVPNKCYFFELVLVFGRSIQIIDAVECLVLKTLRQSQCCSIIEQGKAAIECILPVSIAYFQLHQVFIAFSVEQVAFYTGKSHLLCQLLRYSIGLCSRKELLKEKLIDLVVLLWSTFFDVAGCQQKHFSFFKTLGIVEFLVEEL